MRKLIFLFVVVLASCSAGDAVEETVISKPDHFIEQEDMIRIMTDFRLTEATIRQMAGYGEDTRIISKFYYDNMFAKYEITPEIYKENLDYYANDPKLMHEMSAEVVNRLTEMYTEISTRK
jgi:hypothetical protein